MASIPFLVYVLVAPLLGLVQDKVGMRCFMLTAGFMILAMSQILFLNIDELGENL